MNRRKSLLMTVLLLFIGGYIYSFELGTGEKEGLTEAGGKLVFPKFSESILTKVEIAFGEERSGVLRGENGQWVLVDPVGVASDPLVVREFFATLRSLEYFNSISGQEVADDGSVYGLAPPELVVSFWDNENRETAIRFGKPHAFSGRRYAQIVAGGGVLLVGNSFLELKKSSFDLRKKELLELSADQIFELKVNGPQSLHFFRDGPSWRGRDSLRTIDVDVPRLDDFIGKLVSYQASGFVDLPVENFEEYGLDDPKLRLTLVLGDGREQVLLYGERENAETGDLLSQKQYFLYVGGGSTIYQISRPGISDFFQPLNHFRPRQPLVSLDRSELDRIVVSRGEASPTLSFQRDADGGWKNEHGVSSDVVEDWVSKILNVRILSYLEDREGQQLSGEHYLSLELFFRGKNDSLARWSLVLEDEVAQAGVSDLEPLRVSPRFGSLTALDGERRKVVVGAAAIEVLKEFPPLSAVAAESSSG